jgi:hypothetical protein
MPERRDVALHDLPLELFVLLELNRPELNQPDPENRPACARPSARGYQFDRQGDVRRQRTVPEAIVSSARVFCGSCSVRESCRRTGDRLEAEGLWGGVYRRKVNRRVTGTGRTVRDYETVDLLAVLESVPA